MSTPTSNSPRTPHRIAAPSLAFAALTTALLGACIPAPEPAPAPSLDIPPAWTSAEDAAALPGAPVELDAWWTSFGDAALNALVDEALEANLDLRAAAARVEQAAARARIAGAALAPQVGAGFDGARRRQNFIGLPIPGGGDVLSSTSTTYGLALNVSWEVDLWGRLRAGRRASEADLAAARAELAAARLSLAGQTAKTYFALTEAARQTALAEEILESRSRTARQVRRRYEAGLRPALDLRLALSSEGSAEASLAARRQAQDATRRQLEVILGRYPAGAQGAAGDLPEVERPVPAGLPSEILVRRPDLAAAEARLAAAGARVDEARRALYPSLRLTGSAGTSSAELDDLLDGDFGVWSLAGNLLQPLFQGGRLRSAVELAEGSRDEALALYSRRLLGALAEVETRLTAEGLLRDQRRALESASEQARAAQQLAEERYTGGLLDYLSVLESQRQAATTESQLLELRRRQLDLRVDLLLALGGGFEDTVPNSIQTNVRMESP